MAEDKRSAIDTDMENKVTTFAENRQSPSVKDDDADVAPTPPAEEDWKTKGPFIKYTGHATLRSITEEEWIAAGVPNQKYTEWNSLNEMKIPKSDLEEQALVYLLKVDGRFEEVDN